MKRAACLISAGRLAEEPPSWYSRLGGEPLRFIVVLLTLAALGAPARCDRQAVLSQVAQMGGERRDAAAWDKRRIEFAKDF